MYVCGLLCTCTYVCATARSAPDTNRSTPDTGSPHKLLELWSPTCASSHQCMNINDHIYTHNWEPFTSGIFCQQVIHGKCSLGLDLLFSRSLTEQRVKLGKINIYFFAVANPTTAIVQVELLWTMGFLRPNAIVQAELLWTMWWPTAYIAYYLLPIAYCPMHIVYCMLPIVYCILCFAFWYYCLLPVADCLLPIAFCLMPNAYCLLPIANYVYIHLF